MYFSTLFATALLLSSTQAVNVDSMLRQYNATDSGSPQATISMSVTGPVDQFGDQMEDIVSIMNGDDEGSDYDGPDTDGTDNGTEYEGTDGGDEQNEGETNDGGDEQNEGETNDGGDEQNEGETNDGGDEQNEGETNDGGDEQNEGETNDGGDEQNEDETNDGGEVSGDPLQDVANAVKNAVSGADDTPPSYETPAAFF